MANKKLVVISVEGGEVSLISSSDDIQVIERNYDDCKHGYADYTADEIQEDESGKEYVERHL